MVVRKYREKKRQRKKSDEWVLIWPGIARFGMDRGVLKWCRTKRVVPDRNVGTLSPFAPVVVNGDGSKR
jgi:hypothetical protein